jgi:hypothetical protein
MNEKFKDDITEFDIRLGEDIYRLNIQDNYAYINDSRFPIRKIKVSKLELSEEDNIIEEQEIFPIEEKLSNQKEEIIQKEDINPKDEFQKYIWVTDEENDRSIFDEQSSKILEEKFQSKINNFVLKFGNCYVNVELSKPQIIVGKRIFFIFLFSIFLFYLTIFLFYIRRNNCSYQESSFCSKHKNANILSVKIFTIN